MIVTRSLSDIVSFAQSNAGPLDDYRIEKPSTVYLPFCEKTDSQPYFTVGLAFEALHQTDPQKRHTVTLMLANIAGAADSEYFFVCGDTFLAGCNSGGRPIADQRMDKALEYAGCPGSEEMKKLMSDSYGIFQQDSGCGFWKHLKKDPDGPGCKHVRGIFHHLISSGGLEKALKDMRSAYDSAMSSTASAASGDVDLLGQLRELLNPADGERFPVLLEGEKGFSKSTTALELAREFEHFEECACKSSMESWDFLGGYVMKGRGDAMWMDGPISRAFRSAAAGKNTLLYLDEIFRASKRERDIFLGLLSPHRGFYRLRTGRPVNEKDGVAEMELLRAPVSKLAILASTNTGSEYSVENDDPAEAERWHKIVVSSTSAKATKILQSAAAEKKLDTGFIAPLVKFREQCEKLKKGRNCRAVPSPRLLIRAMVLASRFGDLRKGMQNIVANLVGRTPEGGMIPEQLKAVNKAINSSL